MPDDSRWKVPAKLVAEDRAKYYSLRDGGSPKEKQYTLEDDEELIDWARNNLNWSDVSGQAVKVDDEATTDFQEGWVNGPMEVINEL
jgi:hypothetical protein